jgi:cellulose biosynthesis protein BcsQ
MLSFNALLACDLILIPAAAERMAIDGVADLINQVQNIMWNKFNLDAQDIRILFTMYKSANLHFPKIVNNARRIWRDNVLSVKIPESLARALSKSSRGDLSFRSELFALRNLSLDRAARFLTAFEMTTSATLTEPESIAFPLSFDDRRSLNSYQPKHPGAIAYERLADWLIHCETG